MALTIGLLPCRWLRPRTGRRHWGWFTGRQRQWGLRCRHYSCVTAHQLPTCGLSPSSAVTERSRGTAHHGRRHIPSSTFWGGALSSSIQGETTTAPCDPAGEVCTV